MKRKPESNTNVVYAYSFLLERFINHLIKERKNQQSICFGKLLNSLVNSTVLVLFLNMDYNTAFQSTKNALCTSLL